MITHTRRLEIEYAVVELLEEYDLTTYPISIKAVLESLQIDLVPYSSLNEREKHLTDLASQDKAFNITSRDYMRAQVICDNIRDSYFKRSRFSGGHETGHIWLGHEEYTPNREDEANYFAGYLLVPHPLILAMNNPSPFSICEHFGVSEDCALIAIAQANNRKSEGTPWRSHEKWLLNHVEWKGGGSLGRP